ncbi:MAG: glycerol kinase GlpK [Alphaproteobacteria bacterium]|nr:glycerol kinase GlpK [Alphaproteobacteria bacterium]
MKNLLLAIDQGTTSTRALVFNDKGEVLALAQKELSLFTPHDGWVEQDPEAIWNDTLATCLEVVAKVGVANIAAIGITNQRETTVVWDKATGKPVYNAIVWQDRRTAGFCASLKNREPEVQQKTGLLCDPYFSGTKIRWVLDNVEGAKGRDLLFGTIDTFLLWRLTGGKVHATDATNASRTMLFNINTQSWDAGLLDMVGVPASMLPDVRDSGGDFGTTELLGAPLPVRAILGDQQAALFGQACYREGMVKSTYGTGCFALMNIGTQFKASQNKLLTTIAWRLKGKTTYAIEGAIFVAGAAVQFLRDNLKLIKNSAETEGMATSVPDAGGVMFVPALTGLGAPFWDPHARGGIFGLTRGTTPAHIVRATLEAQAYQTRDLMDAMRADTGITPATLRVDGGLSRNNFVCAQIANQLGCAVERPVNVETTAWGAAALAGLESGVFKSLDDITSAWRADARFEPHSGQAEENAYAKWRNSVRRIMSHDA